MTKETQIQAVEALVSSLLTEDQDYFLVEVSIKPVNNIKVYLDADSGVIIEKCVSLNRKLYRAIVESELLPDGEFSLEVSSPGVDEPLRSIRQYRKNIGRHVEVVQTEGPVLTGKLTDATEDAITLEVEDGKGKKKTIATHVVLYTNIKTTVVQIVF
ncbi:MAG: ribosome maturation factor [bacterium]|jgi:ribosome maturation factor RimP